MILLQNVMHLKVGYILRYLIVNCGINSIVLEPFRELLYVFSNSPIDVARGIKLHCARDDDYDTFANDTDISWRLLRDLPISEGAVPQGTTTAHSN